MAPDECEHENFGVKAGVHRLTDDAGVVRNYVAELEIHCTDCEQPFHFLCEHTGYSFKRPTVNVGALTLHAPIAPGEAPMPTAIRYEAPSTRPPE